MRLNSISIINYKNLLEVELKFPDKINCFVGNNGMGKTNILDAIYYLSFCKSHSNSIDSQNINHDNEFLMLQGKYSRRDKEEVIYCGIKRRQKKQFKRNKKDYERLADHIGLLPLVLISPKDHNLINGGSDERRKFMDGVISQYNRQYLNALTQYNHALKQRNALLKVHGQENEMLFEMWEEMMVKHGNYIFQQRQEFLDKFIPIFQDIYQKISAGEESVSLVYKSHLIENDLSEKLLQNRAKDKIVGFTTSGIHKDDMEMLLGDFLLKRVGSQGQNKTYLISIKLAQFIFLKEAHKIAPILLLDDIFDKLDSQRVRHIVELVSQDIFGQIFISDTNREHLDEILSQLPQTSTIFEVKNGEVNIL